MPGSLMRALLGGALVVALPAAAHAEPPVFAQLQAAVVAQAAGELKGFYAHQDRPLWVTAEGRLDDRAATALLALVRTARYDGLDPRTLGADELALAIQRADRDPTPATLAHAELLLSRTLAAYAAAMRRPEETTDMLYEHDVLRPFEPMMQTTLAQAEAAGSIADYVEHMQWMHPMYAPLREALLSDAHDASQEQAAVRTLERLRALPAPPWQRHVVIDAAGARLWMYEGDRPVDSMRVVVGKTDTQTPAMAGYIRYAVLNPYWNVPDNIIRERIAPGVLSGGAAYLRTRSYEVLSGWGDDAQVLDPAKIDWRKVRDGTLEVHVRQRPSATNAMGKVKYEFPNPLGIYLHDTPEKNLLQEDARQFSSGCIRLEDAERLGRWLLGRDLPAGGTAPEQKLDLPQPVPVYVTYLTAHVDGGSIAVGPDPYGRDRSPARALATAHAN